MSRNTDSRLLSRKWMPGFQGYSDALFGGAAVALVLGEWFLAAGLFVLGVGVGLLAVPVERSEEGNTDG